MKRTLRRGLILAENSEEVSNPIPEGDERVNVQLRMVQQESENQTEDAIHINQVTNLWNFVDEDKDTPVTGFAVAGFENLPPSLQNQLDEERKDWLKAGGNVYMQARVKEFVDMVDDIDRAENRFREGDSLAFEDIDGDPYEYIEQLEKQDDLKSAREEARQREGRDRE